MMSWSYLKSATSVDNAGPVHARPRVVERPWCRGSFVVVGRGGQVLGGVGVGDERLGRVPQRVRERVAALRLRVRVSPVGRRQSGVQGGIGGLGLPRQAVGPLVGAVTQTAGELGVIARVARTHFWKKKEKEL